jgi:hypothetical protein
VAVDLDLALCIVIVIVIVIVISGRCNIQYTDSLPTRRSPLLSSQTYPESPRSLIACLACARI